MLTFRNTPLGPLGLKKNYSVAFPEKVRQCGNAAMPRSGKNTVEENTLNVIIECPSDVRLQATTVIQYMETRLVLTLC